MKNKFLYFPGIILLLYVIALLFDYTREKEELDKKITLEVVAPFEAKILIENASYLFSYEAWSVKEKSKPIEDKSSLEQAKLVGKPLSIDAKKSPIEVCYGERCYLFIGFKDNYAIFWGSDAENKEGFLYRRSGEYLDSKIKLEKMQKGAVVLSDQDFNTTYNIAIFDVNVSQYLPKETE